MRRTTLGKELKIRQEKYVPLKILKQMSDTDIIQAYVTCSTCGKVWLEKEELERIIQEATSTQDFLNITGRQICC